jgi:hypothetical protein
MLKSVGSTAVWKPSPPPMPNQSELRMPFALRVALGPPQLPLSWRPMYT